MNQRQTTQSWFWFLGRDGWSPECQHTIAAATIRILHGTIVHKLKPPHSYTFPQKYINSNQMGLICTFIRGGNDCHVADVPAEANKMRTLNAGVPKLPLVSPVSGACDYIISFPPNIPSSSGRPADTTRSLNKLMLTSDLSSITPTWPTPAHT